MTHQIKHLDKLTEAQTHQVILKWHPELAQDLANDNDTHYFNALMSVLLSLQDPEIELEGLQETINEVLGVK